MKRTEKTTAKHLSFSASSLHLLQRKAFVLPSCLGRWRGLSFALLLALSLALSTSVKAQNNNSIVNRTEISTKSGDNKEKSNKYSMPSIYKDKLSNFLQEEENLFYTRINDVPASKYTVDFVLKEMDSDWGITKDNQLLFIWHCVYEVITGKDLYDGEDGDSKRLEEFEKVLANIRDCESRYKEGIMPYAEKLFAEYDRRSAEAREQSVEARKRSAEADRRSAEARKRSAEAREQSAEARKRSAEAREQSAEARKRSAEAREQSAEARKRSAEAREQSAEARKRFAEARKQSAEADRRSAEARKETMKADSLGIREMVKYYNLCIKNPATNDRNEMQAVISAARDIIQNCKEFGIDYRAIILKEVSDRRKVDEILKFYGVESK